MIEAIEDTEAGELVKLYEYDLTKRYASENANTSCFISSANVVRSVTASSTIPHLSIIAFGKEHTFTQDIGIDSFYVQVKQKFKVLLNIPLYLFLAE